MDASAVAPLVFHGLLSTPTGQLLGAILVLAVVVLIGRVLLSLAWKLLLVAALIVGVLYALGVSV
jgi:hypothetical protein